MNLTYYKTVEWAYPTSPAAVSLGHGKTGCWLVERTSKPNYGARIVSGHLDVRDAITAAEAMPEPWDPIGQSNAEQELARLTR